MKSVAIIIAKGISNRLPNKNFKDFNGKPMIVWNIEKCLDVFNNVYVSSDSEKILSKASEIGAIPIKRGEELCGECPIIPVYKHAYKFMKTKPEYIVSVQANSPTIPIDLLRRVKTIMDTGECQELMTCFPDAEASKYANKGTRHEQYVNTHFKWCSGVWAMTANRLLNYIDPYQKTPEVLIKDDSIDIHTIEEFNAALEQYEFRKK